MIEKYDNLLIIIPTLNEEDSIGYIINSCKKLTNNIIVVDGLSVDDTVDIAKKEGAEVVYCKKKGKGNAIIKGLKYVLEKPNIDYIAYLDGDSTYDPNDIKLLLNKMLEEKKLDVIIGNRLPNREKNSIKFVNIIGNYLFSFLIRLITKVKITDSQSGLRLLSKKATIIYSNCLESSGFDIETEMIIKGAKKGLKFGEVPVSYKCRNGYSKLNPFKDGYKILKTIIKYC
ncbi:MAG: glycosyltransferase family 2 protein [Candidatus Heimdallarchaeum endolithica]|uniref:Glycosyltransferase family 2 protein n=1 Tax=Candidatus Heimdallarchaeum endolithica TaxID=2876572 RepID=A0A9Y1BT89_9ARCH|nr:MAG: glycosyltransferase family 2 protein [Candidatus Heimdallarchaeum endolithica]